MPPHTSGHRAVNSTTSCSGRRRVCGCTTNFLLKPDCAMQEADASRMQARGLDVNLVTNWEGRPKRVRKPPPRTYWEEYVATDEWYLRELVADVPAEELDAALCDEDWGTDMAMNVEDTEDEDEEEDDGEGEEEDSDYSESSSESSDGGDTEDEGSRESVDSEVDPATTDTPNSPAGSDT